MFPASFMLCRISLEHARNYIGTSSLRDVLSPSRSIVTKPQSFPKASRGKPSLPPSLRASPARGNYRKRSGSLKSQSGRISKDIRYKARYSNTKRDVTVSKKLLEPYVLSERLKKLCSE